MSGNDTDLLTILKDLISTRRYHAGLHATTSNDEYQNFLVENGVLKEFIEVLTRDHNLFFKNAKHRGMHNDPPDCEAIDKDGNTIGIEIRELVDEQSAKNAVLFNKEGQKQEKECEKLNSSHVRYDWKDWEGILVDELQKIIFQKSKKLEKSKGGPYNGHILLIFSDEPWLELDYVKKCIDNHQFENAKNINSAFFLLTPRPNTMRYECYELRFREQYN